MCFDLKYTQKLKLCLVTAERMVMLVKCYIKAEIFSNNLLSRTNIFSYFIIDLLKLTDLKLLI